MSFDHIKVSLAEKQSFTPIYASILAMIYFCYDSTYFYTCKEKNRISEVIITNY